MCSSRELSFCTAQGVHPRWQLFSQKYPLYIGFICYSISLILSPMRRIFVFLILLSLQSLLTETPVFIAMRPSVSPFLTFQYLARFFSASILYWNEAAQRQ